MKYKTLLSCPNVPSFIVNLRKIEIKLTKHHKLRSHEVWGHWNIMRMSHVTWMSLVFAIHSHRFSMVQFQFFVWIKYIQHEIYEYHNSKRAWLTFICALKKFAIYYLLARTCSTYSEQDRTWDISDWLSFLCHNFPQIQILRTFWLSYKWKENNIFWTIFNWILKFTFRIIKNFFHRHISCFRK